MSLLEIRNLRTRFATEAGTFFAVDDLSLAVPPGGTLAVVGESGCGKSVTALSVMRLVPDPPGKIAGGEIVFRGLDLLRLSEKQMREVRGRRISMIFQEPMSSLNPVIAIGEQIAEAIRQHQRADHRTAHARAIQALREVGIPDPEERAAGYPHQLSGGMRQRVMIAMALSCDPDLLIADEPTTALDVTIQAQILDLIRALQRRKQMAMMLITHDLGVVAETCEDVAVMYAGRVVERARVSRIFRSPAHPYTAGLLRSVPAFEGGPTSRAQPLRTIPGAPPSLARLPTGCRFRDRCDRAIPICARVDPPLEMKGEEQLAACHNPVPPRP
ncbi:MAG TPA: ABC transporter ATP-binding protein [Myxococcaceae bacterium]|nr:ABC transporter ATP-binding protein [Myxococcaceae bacterium]